MSSNFSNNIGQSKINYIVNTTGVDRVLTNLDTFTLWTTTVPGVKFTLPDPATTFAGWSVKIKNASTGTIDISGGGFNIDGAATLILNRNDMIEISNDGTSVNYIVGKYTFAATKTLFSLGATNIVDGQPSFSRANILSSTSALNFADNNSSFIQCILPPDFVQSSAVTFTIVYAPNSVTAGNFIWYLYAAALEGTDAITTAPTPPSLSGGNWTGTTLTQASNAVINSRQSLSFTVPLFGLSAGKTLLLKLLNTASPAATNPLLLAANATYQSYQDFSY